VVGSTVSAAEPTCPENESATQCAAKQEENPIAGIVKVLLENNTSYLIGPNERTLNVLNLQPIIPLALGKKLTLVALSRIPLVWNPNGAMPTGTTFGMGDITTNLFVTASARRVVHWGIGPVLQFPTGTHRNLGAFDSGKFSLGPTGALFVTPGPFVAGVMVFNIWSVAGRETSRTVNTLRLQPFFNYNLPAGWYLVTSPEILANWTVADNDGWLVPVGAGFGRVGLLKKVGGALGLEVQAFWNAVRPDFGPPWTLRVQAAFFLPKLGAKPSRSKRTRRRGSRSTSRTTELKGPERRGSAGRRARAALGRPAMRRATRRRWGRGRRAARVGVRARARSRGR